MNDLERIEGLHEGFLNDYEKWLFACAVRDGLAYRAYEGGSGFMGLPKVRLRRELAVPRQECGGSK